MLAASTLLAFWWTTSGRLTIGGDEPHYLIIAASVVRDFDFDVSNNYEHEAVAREFIGALQPHALPRGTSLWPQHMPGLGVLLAIPFGLGGVAAVRVGLAALLIAALGMAVYRWSLTCLRPADAALATLAVLACSPVLFGASQIYPDLPAGVVVLALVGWLWGSDRRTHVVGWCAYWCFTGLLCWLHVKYYAPSAVLGVLGAWRLWQDRDILRFTRATYVTFGVLYVAGPALFSAFSLLAFGDLLGRSAAAELNTSLPRAMEILVGLHLDQVHGMFIHQPLLLAGPVALGWMIRRRHPLTLPWLLLYAALIVPNALHEIPYGGHVGPAGRFGWSAMWLWLLPLGIAARELWNRTSLPMAVRLGVLPFILYQAVLAFAWVFAPNRLFNGLFPPDVWQPSLFPTGVMLSLPKFGLHGDLGYPPNVVWILAVVALIAVGFFKRTWLRCLPAAATVGMALLVLPVEDTLERSLTVPRRYEAEHMPERCAVQRRPNASNGHICRQYTDRVAVAGPFVPLEPESYQLVAVMPPGEFRGPGSVQVVANRGYTAIARSDFQVVPSPTDRFIVLDFDIDRRVRDVEFRVRGFPGLQVDYIDLRVR